MAYVWLSPTLIPRVMIMKRILNILFTRENLLALLLCLILIALLILTADQTPQWIYQGF